MSQPNQSLDIKQLASNLPREDQEFISFLESIEAQVVAKLAELQLLLDATGTSVSHRSQINLSLLSGLLLMAQLATYLGDQINLLNQIQHTTQILGLQLVAKTKTERSSLIFVEGNDNEH